MGLFTNKAAKKAEKLMRDAQSRMDDVLASRQAIINPYAGVTDLSGLISNPFANLQVATEAAEFQAEEADLSLASTLDTLRATGAGAGGATALAQEAARSKRGVAATIAEQEAANEKLRAEGKSQLEQLQLQEAQRVQGIQMSEAARIQQAQVAGKQFVFDTKERREMQQLNRKQAQITGQAQAAVAADQGAAALYSAGIGAVGNIGAAFARSE